MGIEYTFTAIPEAELASAMEEVETNDTGTWGDRFEEQNCGRVRFRGPFSLFTEIVGRRRPWPWDAARAAFCGAWPSDEGEETSALNAQWVGWATEGLRLVPRGDLEAGLKQFELDDSEVARVMGEFDDFLAFYEKAAREGCAVLLACSP